MTAVIAGTENLSSNVWLIGNDSTAEAAKAVPSTEGKRVCTVYGKNPRVLNSAMNAMTFQHHLQATHIVSINKNSEGHVNCQGVSWQCRKADARQQIQRKMTTTNLNA